MTQHSFQAQVSEVLSLVINSLYSHPEVFLRELLSNASDALDKERFLALTAPSDSSDPLRIRLIPNEAERTLVIEDNGIGMDEAELIKNLGTIAHSGSKEFLSQLKEKKDVSLIGQFGVGFYSAYLVADKVTVLTRKRGTDKGHRWESDAKTGFTIEPSERTERGTAVVLHLKEEHKDLLSAWKVRELVTRYSDYVSYPIELAQEKDGAQTFERINQASALWTRPAKEITDEQYQEFYKHLTHDWEPPLARKHFRVEGSQEFTGLVFIPKRPPFDLFSPEERHGVRLHVKRVFIMDDCKELLPRWLRFVRGVVDSEDLPLNVSREILQDSKLVRIIRKQVVKQVLDLLDEVARDRPEDYKELWKNYGPVLKEGLHFDPEYKDRLSKLLRYESSKEEFTSLADYVARMPEEQKAIYYLYGPNLRTVKSSPHIESLKARGYEVLYMVDTVDDWAVRSLAEFEGKPLRSAADEKLDLDEPKTDEEKAKEAEQKPLSDALLEQFKKVLAEQVSEVRVSDRLTDSPSCLVIPDGGLDPYIERLLRAQQGAQAPSQKRILEINTKHPLITTLAKLHEQSSDVDEAIELVYDQALLSEGSPIEDPARVAKRLIKLLQASAEAALQR
ncbi:MAG TPA: molecular chaperone HtpG [Polyangiales bacterium]|nr:molecular chaperone HtpG [Polyangiales bacterium]